MLDLLTEKLTTKNKQTTKAKQTTKTQITQQSNKTKLEKKRKRKKDIITRRKKTLPEPVGTWTGAAVALYTDCVGAYTAAVGTGAGSITGATAVALNV